MSAPPMLERTGASVYSTERSNRNARTMRSATASADFRLPDTMIRNSSPPTRLTIVAPSGGDEPLGSSLQNLISDIMSMPVIDGFDPIESVARIAPPEQTEPDHHASSPRRLSEPVSGSVSASTRCCSIRVCSSVKSMTTPTTFSGDPSDPRSNRRLQRIQLSPESVVSR